MSETEGMAMRHTIAALVTNEPGVLAQVAGMFAARGFNIDSLVVGRTENPELSRMTIVVNGDDAVLEQKLVPVVKVVDYKDVAYVERDLMLVQVSTVAPGAANDPQAEDPNKDVIQAVNDRRSALIELCNIFRARIVDVSPGQVMIEMSGTEEKIEAFIKLIQPFGIVELARTGVIAMPRGFGGPRRGSQYKLAATTEKGTGIDEGDLPPG